MAKRGIENTLKKLQSRVEAGEYYEALQMYKTLSARYLAQDDSSKAIDLLFNGAVAMLERKQWNAGCELGTKILEIYTTKGFSDEEKYISLLLKISDLFLVLNSAKLTFLHAALKWSESCRKKRGLQASHPDLHYSVAKSAWKAGEYGLASDHFQFSNQPKEMATMILEWSSKGKKEECDLYIARAVLQLLTLMDLKNANILFEACSSNVEEQVQQTPLMNFVKFILMTLERDAQPLFQLLRQKYKLSIDRDPSFNQYLDIISNKFYNTPLPQSASGGGMGQMLAQMMKMMMQSE